MRRVLFVVPNSTDMGEFVNKQRVQEAAIPYGVLSISSYLLDKMGENVSIKIVDFNCAPYSGFSDCELEAALLEVCKTFSPDIVAISIMFNHMFANGARAAKMAKKIAGGALVLTGGAGAMGFYEKLLDEVSELDAVCCAEGELPMLELLMAGDMANELVLNRSFWTREGLLRKKSVLPHFIDDLDEIPPINFDLVDLKNYSAGRTSFQPVKKEREVMLPIVTTRGCPFNCVFCLAGHLHGKKIRKMSVRRIISDVTQMIEKYSMNTLSIEDDQFLSDNVRAKDILREIKQFGLSLVADCGFTASLVDFELAKLFKEAGLSKCILAIESGSERVLKDVIDKPIRLSDVKSAVKYFKAQGIFVHAFIVVGLPFETVAEMNVSAEFVKNLEIDWTYATIATPIKGSRMHEICLENGFINSDEAAENAFFQSVITTNDFTADDITKKATEINLDVNFVNNSRIKQKDFNSAKKYMEHVLKKYPSHAFANFYLYKAKKALGEVEAEYAHNIEKFVEAIERDEEWKFWANFFKIEVGD